MLHIYTFYDCPLSPNFLYFLPLDPPHHDIKNSKHPRLREQWGCVLSSVYWFFLLKIEMYINILIYMLIHIFIYFLNINVFIYILYFSPSTDNPSTLHTTTTQTPCNANYPIVGVTLHHETSPPTATMLNVLPIVQHSTYNNHADRVPCWCATYHLCNDVEHVASCCGPTLAVMGFLLPNRHRATTTWTICNVDSSILGITLNRQATLPIATEPNVLLVVV